MGDNNKVAVAGFVSILLVAMVVAVAITSNKSKSDGNISASTKAVQSLCSHTDYQQTCQKSLANTNTDDPKELVKAGFQSTISDLQSAIKSSKLYQDAADDNRTKQALNICERVLNASVKDLLRSFDKVNNLDIQYLHDIKTWLTGALDNHETCIDTFENTTGETGEKMKKLLVTSSEMLSNSMAMVDSVSNFLMEIGLSTQRRLLSSSGDEPPYFVDPAARKLMAATADALKPDIVVAQDGSGQFKTIMGAISSIPATNAETKVIHIKAGTYSEQVIITQDNIKLIGDGPKKTIITGSKNVVDGTLTYDTAVLGVNADNFMAKDLTIENTAGAIKHQAVAVRAAGDKQIYYNCVLSGFQDTLYAHSYRQYYRDCNITGTIDFIFGDAQAVFQKCRLVILKPMVKQNCYVTAQGRLEQRSLGATVMQDCEFVCDPSYATLEPPAKAYLGRPWKSFSRTIIMQSFIDKCIEPEGWAEWKGDFALDTLYYAEYQNRGPGSDTSKRVPWKGIQHITPAIAETFTGAKVLENDEWVTAAGIPYVPGMMKV